MFKFSLVWILLIICNVGYGSIEVPEIFRTKSKAITLGEIRGYYLNKYMNLEACDSAAKEVSKLLIQEDERNYLLNEFARVHILSIKGDNVEALKIVQSFEGNSLIEADKVLQGYYMNVYGVVYYDMYLFSKAKEKYSMAVESFKQTSDSSGLKGNLINLGNACLELKQTDSAFTYYYDALKLEEQGVLIFSETLKSNLAQAYTRVDSLEKAKTIYVDIIAEVRKQNNSYKLVTWLFNLANVLGKMEEHQLAISYYHECDSLAKLYSFPKYINQASYGLASSYFDIGEFEKSSYYYQIYDKTRAQKKQIDFERELGRIEFEHQEELFEKEQSLIQLELLNKQKQFIRLMWFLIALGSLLFLLLVAYLRIRNRNKSLILTNYEIAKRDEKEETIDEEKTIDMELINKLKIELESNKAFTNVNLNLDKLSKKLGTNRSYLSEAINVHFGESYSSLINRYRIKEARMMLISNNYAHYSIEGIAMSVGYNNISSFNTVFKRITGITPSYFRKESQKAEKQLVKV